MTRIFARAVSRSVQSIVTLFRTWLMSSAAISLSLSSPMTATADALTASIVERQLVVRQPELLTTLPGRVDLLRELDQLVDHFLRRDGAVVIGVERLPQLLAEELRLHEVVLFPWCEARP